MFKIIKKFNWIIFSSLLCVFLGIITFQTFINQGFIPLTDENLQILLILDLFLLIIFFYLIFKNVFRIYKTEKKNQIGSQTNLKYVSLFSLFTFLPSLLIAIFSLFIFNFGIQNYFDTQISKAVNNSYEVAKNYLEESKQNVKSDVILMSNGVNRASQIFYSDPKRFKNIIVTEKLLRRIDDVYLIDSIGNIMFSDIRTSEEDFVIPIEDDFNAALEGDAVFITNSSTNKTSVMIKINNLIDTYLYISRNIEKDIIDYLNETEKAVSFYYTVENSQTGIKITFAVVYIVIVTLLLFLSTVIAITFATRLTKPIINLISASDNISKGILDVKVPNVGNDKEFKKLNDNFNNMIDRLKKQQEKLLTAERYSAWETVARKLAHEIKNPLTPIQLSIDRLREKYSSKVGDDSRDFENYLETINRQIKDIENLVNEFSNFARMPRPVFKKISIYNTALRAIDFYKMSSDNEIVFSTTNKNLEINGDSDQLYRVFINLIKNSKEAIADIIAKKPDFKGKISIEILDNKDYIMVKLTDNGMGIPNTQKAMTPYFTTKKNGTGLGLPIVNKIINEHSAELVIKNNTSKEGLTVEIIFPKY